MKNLIRSSVLFALLGVWTGTVNGSVTYNSSSSVPVTTDYTENFSLGDVSMGSIGDISVTLKISATAVIGDFYVSLAQGGSTAVLLNHVGRETGVPEGYGGGGVDVTFTIPALRDVHIYETYTGGDAATFDLDSRLTGIWSADGRIASTGMDTDPRLNGLDSLISAGATFGSGWSLYVSGAGTLDSFSVTAVPEPAETAMAISGLLLGLALFRRPETRSRLMGLIRR